MIELFKHLPYFTLDQVEAFFATNRAGAKLKISRALRDKSIIRLREGYYVTRAYVDQLPIYQNTTHYIEYIANTVVYTPSYLSLEYVLAEYGVLTESVYTITSITTKKTANFTNHLGTFRYKSIQGAYFDDYELLREGDFLIRKATPEKALFDYLYLKRGIVWSLDYFRELRLNIDRINLDRYEQLAKKYQNKKIIKTIPFLKKLG